MIRLERESLMSVIHRSAQHSLCLLLLLTPQLLTKFKVCFELLNRIIHSSQVNTGTIPGWHQKIFAD